MADRILTKAFPLKRLPPELRNRIYEIHYQKQIQRCNIEVSSIVKYLPDPALVCLDRQIRSESIQYFREAVTAHYEAKHTYYIDPLLYGPHQAFNADTSKPKRTTEHQTSLIETPSVEMIRILQLPPLQSVKTIALRIPLRSSKVNWAFTLPLVLTVCSEEANTISARIERHENVPKFLSTADVCYAIAVVLRQEGFGVVKKVGNEEVLDVVACVRLACGLGEEVRETMIGMWHF